MLSKDQKLIRKMSTAIGTQAKLAERLGMCRESISRYSKGARSVPVRVRWACLMLEKEKKLAPTYEAIPSLMPSWTNQMSEILELQDVSLIARKIVGSNQIEKEDGAIMALCFLYALEVTKVERSIGQLVKELDSE